MKRFGLGVLFAIALFGFSQAFSGISEQPKQAVGNAPSGRYQLVLNPEFRGDAFLVDTQTGKIWQRTQITNVQGEPTIWQAQVRVDSEADFLRWGSQQTMKPTETTAH